MQVPEGGLKLDSGANTIATSSQGRINESLVTDYDKPKNSSKLSKLDKMRNQNTVSLVTIQHRVMKRPATCRPGGNTRNGAQRAATSMESKKSTAAASSR